MTELLTQHRPETEILGHRTPVLVSGLPGQMATLVAESLSRDERFDLLPIAITSYRHKRTSQSFGENQRVNLVDYCPFDVQEGAIAVDYTTPQSAENNAISYTALRIPFVMGTTGGNRERIEEMVRKGEISAVIAPNMATEVVDLQNRLDNLLTQDPNQFRNWQFTIRESHQATKRDVSGTAKAIQAQLERLGASMSQEIESVRDPELQRAIGIQNLDAHAYHWIALTDGEGEHRVNFNTKIEGREPYVKGTLEAIDFLDRQIRNGSRGQVFTMSDVIAGRSIS